MTTPKTGTREEWLARGENLPGTLAAVVQPCRPSYDRPKRFTQREREMHYGFYLISFETRATKSSNLESKSFRMGEWFDFL